MCATSGNLWHRTTGLALRQRRPLTDCHPALTIVHKDESDERWLGCYDFTMKLVALNMKHIRLVSALILIISLFNSSNSYAASALPSASMCKVLMPTLKTLYSQDPYSTVIGLGTKEAMRIRNIWKSQSNKLGSGLVKSNLEVLIDEMYGLLNGDSRSAQFWSLSIYKIADACTPENANIFCRTWQQSVSTVLTGGISKKPKISELSSIRKVWANQATKIPMGPTRIALEKAVYDLDELISETKRNNLFPMNVYSALSNDIEILLKNNDGRWPCMIDPVLKALSAIDVSAFDQKNPSEICYEVYSWNNTSNLKLSCSTYPKFEWKEICTKYPYMSLRQIDGSGYTISTLRDSQGNYFFKGTMTSGCNSNNPYEFDVRATTYLGFGEHKFYIDGFNSPPSFAEVQAGGLHAGANQWQWLVTVK